MATGQPPDHFGIQRSNSRPAPVQPSAIPVHSIGWPHTPKGATRDEIAANLARLQASDRRVNFITSLCLGLIGVACGVTLYWVTHI